MNHLMPMCNISLDTLYTCLNKAESRFAIHKDKYDGINTNLSDKLKHPEAFNSAVDA